MGTLAPVARTAPLRSAPPALTSSSARATTSAATAPAVASATTPPASASASRATSALAASPRPSSPKRSRGNLYFFAHPTGIHPTGLRRVLRVFQKGEPYSPCLDANMIVNIRPLRSEGEGTSACYVYLLMS